MFTHDQIWMAIDRLADSRGLSASGLARQAGLDPTSFNRSKRISPNGKPRWPSTESLAKIMAVTNCTMADLLSMMDQNNTAPKVVPHFSYASIKAGRLNDKSTNVLSISFTAGEDSFAVTIEDEALHPLFRSGSIIVADPSTKVKTEDRVLFFSKKNGLMGGILQTPPKKGFSILLPNADFTETNFNENDIEWVARILWASH